MPEETFIPFSTLMGQLQQYIDLVTEDIILPFDDVTLLDEFGVTEFIGDEQGTIEEYGFVLAMRREIAFEIPGMSGLDIVLGGDGGFTELPLKMRLETASGEAVFDSATLTGILALRAPREWLVPMRQESGVWVEDETADRRALRYDGEVIIAADGNISFAGSTSFSLPPSMIGDTGVIVEATNVSVILNDADIPAGAPSGFKKGIYIQTATLHMRDPDFPVQGLTINDAYIGSGGFTASVSADLSAGAVAGELSGFEFELKQFGLDFYQNALVGSNILGNVRVPFFDDTVEVELSLQSNGDFSIRASTSGGGVQLLEIDNLLTVDISALEIARRNGVPEIAVSGTLGFAQIDGVDFPDFELQRLTVNANGEVTIDGGWIDLGDAFAVDFHGFQMELTRIGFGSDSATDENWIGLSGSIMLADGLAAGASVDGMRIWWSRTGALNPRITVEGVGVELVIPDVLELSGSVRFINDPATNTTGFAGDIYLVLPTLNFSGAASLMVGRQGEDTFFYIAVTVDLPVGIPLAQTGAAFYGFQGLIGSNVYPTKTVDEHWYEDWYLNPEVGVTQTSKWQPQVPAFAIGLGATLGTFPDNGFAVSGRFLIALVLPGPLLLIEGRANILAPRTDLSSTDKNKPLFRALFVLDGREGTVLLNIGAQYAKSPLIEISGTMEAFFDFTDPLAWHLYLGVDEPREKRLRAAVLTIFQAQSYWMLSARDLRFGAWVGYDERWKFGPLEVVLAAWVEGSAMVGFVPVQIAGSLEINGAVSLRAFGIGIGLSVNALLAAQAPQPFLVEAAFSVKLNLPWPLPDVGATVHLEWTGSTSPPDFPADNVIRTLSVEHLKTGGNWPEQSSGAPLVPIDGRPIISFDRPVRDAIYAFSGAATYTEEVSGEYTFAYELESVVLRDLSTNADVPIRGVWKTTITPDGTATSKLELFGKNGFAYAGTASNEYAEDLINRRSKFPCGDNVSDDLTCQTFESAPSKPFTEVERFGILTVNPDPDGLIRGGTATISGVAEPVLIVSQNAVATINFDTPVENVKVYLLVRGSVRVVGMRNRRIVDSVTVTGRPSTHTIEFDGEVDSLMIRGGYAAIVRICWEPAGQAARRDALRLYRDVTSQSVEWWYSEEELLVPGHSYRLSIEVRATRSHNTDSDEHTYTREFRFDAADPPALPRLPDWVAPNDGRPDTGNPYASLTPYVDYSVPADGARPVYRTYDVSVAFNQNNVESMYTGNLRIRLFAPGDREVTSPSGLPSAWGRGRELYLTESEQLWLDALDGMTCVSTTVDLGRVIRNTTIRTDASLLLEAELRHEARLFAGDALAYRFSFVTSRYLNFADHLGSFTGQIWVETAATPNASTLTSRVHSARSGGMDFDPAEPDLFEALYFDDFQLAARGFPTRVEWSEMRTSVGGQALLLSSPEPIDWARVDVSVVRIERRRLGSVEFELEFPEETVWIRHADGTKALVFFPSITDDAAPLPAGEFEVRFVFHRDAGADLPVLSVAGDSSDEVANHRLILPAD